MEALIDKLISQVEIPKMSIPSTEKTTAATGQILAGPGQFVTASDQDLQRLKDKNTSHAENSQVHHRNSVAAFYCTSYKRPRNLDSNDDRYTYIKFRQWLH